MHFILIVIQAQQKCDEDARIGIIKKILIKATFISPVLRERLHSELYNHNAMKAYKLANTIVTEAALDFFCSYPCSYQTEM